MTFLDSRMLQCLRQLVMWDMLVLSMPKFLLHVNNFLQSIFKYSNVADFMAFLCILFVDLTWIPMLSY